VFRSTIIRTAASAATADDDDDDDDGAGVHKAITTEPCDHE